MRQYPSLFGHGWITGADPLKLEKIWFFGVNRDFSHEMPQNCSRLPPLGAIFSSAPPHNLKSWIPPWIILDIRIASVTIDFTRLLTQIRRLNRTLGIFFIAGRSMAYSTYVSRWNKRFYFTRWNTDFYSLCEIVVFISLGNLTIPLNMIYH
jgi:hypothetical protein